MATPVSLLDVKHVSVMRGLKTVLHDLTFQIPQGESVAIVGPNGCGKSTLLKTMTRECYPLARPGSSIRILGQDTWHVADLRKSLGMVSSDLSAICSRDMTAREAVLSVFFSSIGVWRHQHITPTMETKAARALDRLHVASLAGRWMTTLSTGEARRVLWARALVHDPKAFVLDEPFNSLDLFAQETLRQTLRTLVKSGLSVILVTHQLSDIIPDIQRVLLLQKGRLIADGQKKTLLTEKRLSALFGLPIRLAHRDGVYQAWH